jgi:hypothetical protein
MFSCIASSFLYTPLWTCRDLSVISLYNPQRQKMSSTLAVCTVPDVLKETLKKFRFSSSPHTNAIIIKVDRDTMTLVVEETLEDCTIEEIRNELPAQQPRFVIISYEMKHSDGRNSYPLALIFYSPSGCSPEQRMLYAGSRNVLVHEGQLTKSSEVRELDEISNELLEEKFA